MKFSGFENSLSFLLVSYCEFRIYRVGVNTKIYIMTTILYLHPPSKLTIWHLFGDVQHVPWGYFQLSTCVEVATPSVTKDLGFHVLIRKMRVSSRFNKKKIDIILSERFFSIPTQECTKILSVHHHLDLFISRKILIYTILNEEKGIWKRQMNWSTSYEI